MSGYKPGSTQFGSIGAVFGEKSHTQTVAEMPSHTHIQDSHVHAETPIWGQIIVPAGSNYGAWGGYGTKNSPSTVATNQYTGGSQAFNVIQPTRAALIVIKT